MRSIRLSLILCILALLVLSLITVSGLVYREAHYGLEQKADSMKKYLLANHQDSCRIERENLDKALLADAGHLASLVRIQLQFSKMNSNGVFGLGVLSAPLIPQGHLFSPFFWVQGLQWKGNPADISKKIGEMRVNLKFDEMVLPPEDESRTAQYYQINTMSGDEWRSPSLGKSSFFFDPTALSSKQLVDWSFDSVELNSNVSVRRVRLKVSKFQTYFPTLPWPIPKGKKGQPPEPKKILESPGPNNASPQPWPVYWTIYIQAAVDDTSLKKALAQFDEELQNDLQQVENSTEASLADLRNRLLLINGITLVAALLIGCLLVHFGLSPLSRLSEAVSKVSEKDFRLQVNAEKLPTELRPINSRLTQTLNLLQRAFTREKQAAADISHELRTPLAAMMTTLEVALKKPRSAEEYQEILDECRTAGQQMTCLVERMLALARLDAGADHLRSREVDVSKLAAQCTSLVRPLAEARGLQLDYAQNGPSCIKADPDKLREVLTNLLHNAIEYNKPQGKIEVEIQRINGHLEMKVSDTGIGISPEAQEHIFERFFRADSSRTGDTLHAGIGLALVKGYVDLMGGRISVWSEVGVGTTFQINLPVTEGEDS